MLKQMVEKQIRARGVKDPRVLAAMEEVPRHLFVPESLQKEAYSDSPLPIGQGQTISQPYIVALMTELAGARPGLRVLEIGTGSGYQTAVLAACGCRVWTVEILETLGKQARKNLKTAGYGDIEYRLADGYRGWIEAAPFHVILLTAAAPFIPPALFAQLDHNGVLIAPLEELPQKLIRFNKRGEEEVICPVRFVPMTGEIRSEST
ncbi:MAG: protein-L-isoaspartate(D-aspartate) O-methyltransferase [Candidatus Krumholzibacteria bacterium]|jgi:protein-L-isoaspartate(D-aspartate) O-methyltransferase|nr:protein-L-isoaspartate(D-aspartate) O-methyltransferase [Candidatus Krumholzibacteria bacterium]MDP6668702.1 protein-L-isoaspartate(D-aspartate) O-methyltransferase [Candidatus Krumholzibacteria bacterium]MDP7022395.1 protein-L-isoaspartate(D-aspartate) O-methyltransferase [Candidatus Krumholzibacteria bacterium]